MSKGLKNRFPPEVFNFWKGIGWYRDMIDDHNDFDCFHHIISPSSMNYQKGKFNKSIFNSCPLNNQRNHLYNPNLHRTEMESRLLKKVADALLNNHYKIKEIDIEFFNHYKKLYNI